MIDSLKKLQVLKDHAVSKSFLTVYLSSSCSWSRRIASKEGPSSGLTSIFFETVPLKYCPTISTSLLTTFSTLISLLRSPAPLLQNASLFVTIFLLNKTLTVSTSQFHDFMYVQMPYIASVVDFLGFGGGVFSATLHWSRSAMLRQCPGLKHIPGCFLKSL